jgi:hypothetical protein
MGENRSDWWTGRGPALYIVEKNFLDSDISSKDRTRDVSYSVSVDLC